MKIILLFLTLLIILIILVTVLLFLKLNTEYRVKTKKTVEEILSSNSFEIEDLLVASKKITIALNKQYNRIAIVEDFNPENPEIYHYYEIPASSIVNIETSGFTIKFNFRIKGEITSVIVPSFSKEAKAFCHNILKKILFRKLEFKYPNFKFDNFATSDWECSYIWAFDSTNCAFAFLSTQGNQMHRILNLRKEIFTIDISYNYFELSLMGQPMQLLIYEKGFLQEVFSSVYEMIRSHITAADDGQIFYDNYSNIIYLTNGYNNIQSIVLDKIEDVYYRENRLQFTLLDDKKIINYPADKDFINKFENFVVGYNLRKIANNFDYKSDRLINVNTNTKFIVDITRDRVVYCANLNKFYSFSYMTIAFSNLKSADVIKAPSRNYVRIKTLDDDILDVTCLKLEIAYYVKAQIDTIIQA